jgi:hypothetical protein
VLGTVLGDFKYELKCCPCSQAVHNFMAEIDNKEYLNIPEDELYAYLYLILCMIHKERDKDNKAGAGRKEEIIE